MKYLNFFYNVISQDLEGDLIGEIFKMFISFEVLDIFFNRILLLLKFFLRNLNELRYIDVSNNGLFEWLVDVSKMLNFKLFDLFENKFVMLSLYVW